MDEFQSGGSDGKSDSRGNSTSHGGGCRWTGNDYGDGDGGWGTIRIGDGDCAGNGGAVSGASNNGDSGKSDACGGAVGGVGGGRHWDIQR